MSSRLDEIAKTQNCKDKKGYPDHDLMVVSKQAMKDLMLEIIGEDEDIRDPADLRKNISMPLFRNSLRAEQRKRISEL